MRIQTASGTANSGGMRSSVARSTQSGLSHLFLLALLCTLTSCALFKTRDPGIGDPISWNQLDGWSEDDQDQAWPALLHSCKAMKSKPGWQSICLAAEKLDQPDRVQARLFFETWFRPHRVYGTKGRTEGLITGYYEPLLFGSREPSSRYRFPLYSRPESLLTIDLGERFPALKNARVRGRLVGNRVIPFYSRADIEADHSLLAGSELLWLDDRDALFFLQIQGSGRVQLPDGRIIGVGYSDQNGHVYRAIGKVLVDRKELALEDVSLFSIRQWLRDHPDQAQDLLNQNPSYVFFVLRDKPGEGPVGSLNVPLTPRRSIAIDPELISLGVPMWLSTHYPGDVERPLKQLVFAQDTGGAIKGTLRADLFWGHDTDAERAAGTMKSRGSLVVLLPHQE